LNVVYDANKQEPSAQLKRGCFSSGTWMKVTTRDTTAKCKNGKKLPNRPIYDPAFLDTLAKHFAMFAWSWSNTQWRLSPKQTGVHPPHGLSHWLAGLRRRQPWQRWVAHKLIRFFVKICMKFCN